MCKSFVELQKEGRTGSVSVFLSAQPYLGLEN